MLKTSHLILKKLTKKDIPQLVEQGNEEIINKYTEYIPYPLTEKGALEVIKSKHDIIQFGIFLKKEKQLIGMIELHKIKIEEKKAKLGYWIGKNYRGKGYASEAIEKIINYGFSKVKLERLSARTLQENKASNKTLTKFGFKNIEPFYEDGKSYFRWQLTNTKLQKHSF